MATTPDDSSTLSSPPSELSTPTGGQSIPSPQSVEEILDSVTVEKFPQKRAHPTPQTGFQSPETPRPYYHLKIYLIRSKRVRRDVGKEDVMDPKTQFGKAATARTRPPSQSIKTQIWTPDYLLTDPKSKLGKCRLGVCVPAISVLINLDLINLQTWEMLSAEDRTECANYLPKSDLKKSRGQTSGHNQTDTGDLKGFDEDLQFSDDIELIDGFFEGNVALQADMRTFQVHKDGG